MFGKGALIFVAGFTLVFGLYQAKLNALAVSAADNFNNRYMETLVHEASMSAMNLGVNEVWANDTDSAAFNVFQTPCTSFVRIDTVGLDTIRVRVNTTAQIFDDDYFVDNGTTMTLQDSAVAYFTYNTPLSRYFWFTNNEGNVWWVSGDTLWGPLHTNTYLQTYHEPVFYGKATARNGIYPNPATSSAHFYGGWEVGVDASIPTDMSILVNAATAGNGAAPMNTKSLYDENMAFEFLSNGDVIRNFLDSGTIDTVSITTIAPTGVIMSTEDIRVQGVIDGSLTIYTTEDIFIDDDITYADDPLVNPSSDDVLGLVAGDDIWVTDNAANNSDCTIQASLMAVNGRFGAENYASRPASGVLRILGSIVQDRRGPVGTFNWRTGNIVSGFSKRYYYDPRLQNISPPYYPYIRLLRLVAWWE